MKGRKGEKNRQEDRGAQGMSRVLHFAAKCRYGREARNEDLASSPETGHFFSSYGRFPGHEANYPILSRLLWEMGKDEEKKEKDGEIKEKDRRQGKD